MLNRTEFAYDEANPLHVTLVSTADWDNPYWTNKQHMALQFARRGHKVLYIESQGLRAPTATARDVKRMLRRLFKGARPPRKVENNLWVWSPLVIPFQGNPIIRRINRCLLFAGLKTWQTIKGVSPQLLWTYSPMTTELYDLSRYDLVAYHAVDDVKTQPGVPRDAIAAAEDQLVRRADLIFVTAHHLLESHSSVNPATYYFSNVADFAHFQKAMLPETSVPADLTNIPGPRIGFVGAISSYKIDFPLIYTLAKHHPQWSFVLIGEVGEGDPGTDASMFDGLDNVHFLGGRPYSTLPNYLKGLDVVMQPNLINDYTRSMFPMKFFEYLSAGKPVVSTPLPALSEYHDVTSFCATPAEFALAIQAALDGSAPPLDQRLNAAREQTYDKRTEKMLALVRQKMAAARRSS
ncbi:glycosyltransferase [Lysobacter arvi]|uniref:Glycosyltransferase n=1 Tax=Lysobacter arvi TaxID=3038776 RepID=A0ABU1C903_9GAMM|nr:glycosyltransferase [Lysobacter arvi]MDR0181666.1 glycosyltransferase [Lysobacter arvi]